MTGRGFTIIKEWLYHP